MLDTSIHSFHRSHLATLALAGIACLTTMASAQEAMYTAAATMPSPGTGVVRPQVNYFRYGTNPLNQDEESTDVVETMTTVAWGLDRGLALFVDVPVAFERENTITGDDDWNEGVEDIDAMLKWRIYKHDSGGIDTVRAALLGGAKVASGDSDEFSSGSVNPHVGAVLTVVKGVHGFNQDISFTWNTGGSRETNLGGDGPSDAISFNSAYVYRVWPEQFTSESNGAWYVTAEINNLYETNGDFEMRWAPGLMYEGRRVSFEVMAQFPLYDDLEERPELDLALGIGVRVSF